MSNPQGQGNLSQEFSRLLEQVHVLGREVIQPHASDVDLNARFPFEAINTLRKLGLLSAYVPKVMGGMGLDVTQVAKLCETLGHYDGSVAMIYAMHQIQVACLVHHAVGSKYIDSYIATLVSEQRLIASATTEVGIGGDLRSSICAVEIRGDDMTLTKKAPVISYGAHADDILVTCRRASDAPASDQVQVLVHKDNYQLEPISDWDTLGFRGTCSRGFVLTASGRSDQVLPSPFADILSRTMHPFSHIVWGSLWLGIAASAVNLARSFVRAEAKRNPSIPPTSALRLAEVDIVLQGMRNNINVAVTDYHRLLIESRPEAFDGFGFAIRTNNLKLSSSTLVVDIVSRALLICGISGYRNDSNLSLGRHLRDAYGAALMVNNDRIMNHNATMLLTQREG
jgi:acyl-CoA dehydrogenase